MQAKKIWAMYWSATGTTKTVVTAVADKMADKLGLPLEEYDFIRSSSCGTFWRITVSVRLRRRPLPASIRFPLCWLRDAQTRMIWRWRRSLQSRRRCAFRRWRQIPR